MLYQAVLFDLDGTLLDTLDDISTCANHVLSEKGFPTHAPDAYRQFVGDGADMLIRRVLPEGERDENTIRLCLDAFVEYYKRGGNTKVRPYDGIPELLDGLTGRGLKLSILSNKPHELTGKAVDGLLSEWEFDLVLGQRDSIPRKPDPAGAFEIANALNVPPSQFLYLGDTAVDMRTAVSAGMFPVGACWGFRDKEELIESGAKALIKRPPEMLDLLDTYAGPENFDT